MSSFWPVFGFIFSTRDLRRNLRMWWRVRTTSDDVIFTSNVPSCQVAIYWIVRGQLFLFLITSPKITFSKVWLVSETAQSDLSKEPIKVSICIKMRYNSLVCDGLYQVPGALYCPGHVGAYVFRGLCPQSMTRHMSYDNYVPVSHWGMYVCFPCAGTNG